LGEDRTLQSISLLPSSLQTPTNILSLQLLFKTIFNLMSIPKSDEANFHLYNATLQPYARENRNNSTRAESCLWKYVLRAKQMKGYGFRRQRPVLNFIADFMCKELNLIIEVDGITHTNEETAANDIKRQQELEKAGFTVIRFTDEEILTAINRVGEVIAQCIEEIELRKNIGG
jgi:very-short-patch-repair endonuclease